MNLDIPCTLRVGTHKLLGYLLIIFHRSSNGRATYWPPCITCTFTISFYTKEAEL